MNTIVRNAIVAMIALAFVATVIRGYRVLKRRRLNHVALRAPMTDAQFVEELHVEATRFDVCVQARRGIAKIIHVTPESLYPSDSIALLEGMSSDGFDLWEVGDLLHHMERDMRLRLNLKGAEPYFTQKAFRQMTTVGDVIRHIANHWDILNDKTTPG